MATRKTSDRIPTEPPVATVEKVEPKVIHALLVVTTEDGTLLVQPQTTIAAAGEAYKPTLEEIYKLIRETSDILQTKVITAQIKSQLAQGLGGLK